MKYLILTADKYPPTRVDVDVLFGQEMPSRGHRIDWIMQSNAPRRRSGCETYGGGTAWIGRSRGGESFFAKLSRHMQWLLHSFRAIGLAKRNAYDFIQAKNVFVHALPALIAARLAGTKFTYWLSYPFPEQWLEDSRMRTSRYPLFSRLRGHLAGFLLYRIILPSADFVFVQSEQMKRDIASRGIDPAKMHPVPMGVDADMIAAGEDAGDRREPIVLYVGTMLPVRRMDFLIRVFAGVVEQVPVATLYMVGGESDEDIQRLKNESSRLGIEESVVFTGMLPFPEAMSWMRKAQVCVSPFYPTPILNSTSPTKLVEYMSQGAAVVANNHPEQDLVIAESGGGLCVPWDERQFSEAIVELLRDPGRANRMGGKGRAYVKRCRSYPHIADALATKYREVIGADSGATVPSE